MEVPCVRVPRDSGEATRQELADAELIDRDYEIDSDEDAVFIPILDPDAVSDEYDLVSRQIEPRSSQTLPGDVVGFDPSYERIGNIAIIEEADPDHALELADAIVASDLPLTTVLNKRSEVKGEERVRDWEVLVGDGTEVVHTEYGCSFELDLASVYFSPAAARTAPRS